MIFDTPELQLLKEAAGRRSQNGDVTDALVGWFEGRSSLRVLDLRAGTGANVRALAPLLSPDQSWVLYVRDAGEEAVARDHLTRWAPAAQTSSEGLLLDRQGLRLTVQFRTYDVVRHGGTIGDAMPDLAVIDTDLMRYPPAVIQRLVHHLASGRVAILARSVYDGRLKLQPHHAADSAMTAALHRRLMRDDGSGPAAGPVAITELSEQTRLSGYSVIEGPSNVHLRAADATLIRAVQRQMAEAQRLVAKGHDKMIDTWLQRARSSLEISETDLIALPSSSLAPEHPL